MYDAFYYPTSDGRSVEQIIFAPLLAEGVEMTLVDAGARNGLQLSSALAQNSRLIGFEPNPDEYQKLVTHTTDAERAGLSVPKFKKEEFHNCALWDVEEMRPFYITAGTGACTLMGKTVGKMTERMWLDGNEAAYGTVHTDVRTTIPIQCRPLSTLVPTSETVDLFKLDVEGAELAILRGAASLFKARKILFVKTEFVCTPYYESHPVLGYQHVFLHEYGFRLIDFDLNHARYSRDRTTIPAEVDRRNVYAGDAYFILDPERGELPPFHMHRMAVIAIAHGFNSLAVSLLRDAGLLRPQDIKAVEAALGRINWRRRLKFVWNGFPTYAASVLARLRR